MKVDDDTQKALLLFNRRAEAAEAAKATERRLAKATQAKDEAAEALKRAQDGGGGAQAVSEAEATWREAVDTWQRLRDGEEVPEQKATPAGGEPTEEPTDDKPDDEDAPAAAPTRRSSTRPHAGSHRPPASAGHRRRGRRFRA